VWQVKKLSLLTAMSAKHSYKFVVLSPVMVTGNSCQIAEKIALVATNKETNSPI
jgi:hypothetical protein